MTLRSDRRHRLETTVESYRLLLAALPKPDGAEAEILETVIEIADDERALRALADLARDPDAPRRAGLTPDEFLRCRGIHLDPVVSITVQQTGVVCLAIRDAERCYDVEWAPDCSFVINASGGERPALP
jgi:hypothetical protein